MPTVMAPDDGNVHGAPRCKHIVVRVVVRQRLRQQRRGADVLAGKRTEQARIRQRDPRPVPLTVKPSSLNRAVAVR